MKEILTKIHTFADRFEKLVEKIPKEKMDVPIAENKWSPRQIIHHLADAQSQAYFRTKWLVAEDKPTLKTFEQDVWVDMATQEEISGSICLIRGVYKRWDYLLQELNAEDWKRSGHHPETGEISVREIVEYYGPHGESHLAQLESVLI